MRYNIFMLKDYLKKKKISTYRLAKETGIPYSTLNDLVNRKTDIDSFRVGAAKKLADFLDMSLDEFYGLCEGDTKMTVQDGDVVGTIGVKGRRYYVEYEIDGEQHHDDICKVCNSNNIFVETMAKWSIRDTVEDKEFDKIYELHSHA